jgi:hypothetical protein
MDKLSELRLNINAARIRLSVELEKRYQLYWEHYKSTNKCAVLTEEIKKFEVEYESLLKEIKWNLAIKK